MTLRRRANLAGILFSLLVLTGSAQASLSFSPDSMVLDLQPGGQAKAKFLLVNQDRPIKLFMELEYRSQGPYSRPVSEWVRVEPQELELAANESRQVVVTLKDLSPERTKGETILSLFARERIGKQFTLDVKTGIPIFVRWQNEDHAIARVVGLSRQKLPDGSWQIETRVQNIGALHILPFGLALIKDELGMIQGQADMRANQFIPAQEGGSFTWHLPAVPAEKLFKLDLELFWQTLYGRERLGAPLRERISVRFDTIPVLP